MQDGLYLHNTWVAQVEVAITKQANDLSNPTAINSNYANLFTLPDTSAIRSLLQNAEQVDAGGRDPYRLIPAKLIDEGEVIFSGNAALLSFQGGWKVSLTAALKGLFEQLADLKLANLDLSRYDHPWTIPTIISLAGKSEGVIYPAIDYGSVDNGVFAQDTLTPAIYAKSVINTMLNQFSYRAVGDWQKDMLYNRLIIPFVEDEPVAHDLDWQQARMARVTVTGVRILGPKGSIDTILEFNRDAEPLAGWVDGAQNNFKAESFRYVCDVAMRLHVTASHTSSLKVDFGAVETILAIEKNGQHVAEERVAHGGPWGAFTFPGANLFINLDEHIDCVAGDQIQIRFISRKQTTFAQFTRVGVISEESTWAFFQPDVAIKAGDTWLVSTNMPDLTCAELLKSVALMMSGTYEVNEVARTIELRTLDAVIANEANTQDLSHCIEESTEPENAVTISPYGQRNLLKWKQQDDKTLIGWGDGVITCGAQNIPLEATLFELPFSAVISSSVSLAGYGSPPFIKTRVISGSGANVQVSRQAAPPCLLLAEPTRTVMVTVNVVNDDLSVSKTPIPLTGCWWHARPEGVVTVANAFGLGFDRPLSVYTREQTMSQRYFNALRRMLRRPRQLTPSVYLRPVDFATLDLYAPVRLRAVRAGSLDLNDNFYYLSKVPNYISGRTCTMVLVPY
ncbi:hypothetical protein [Spirosoma lituiforme]